MKCVTITVAALHNAYGMHVVSDRKDTTTSTCEVLPVHFTHEMVTYAAIFRALEIASNLADLYSKTMQCVVIIIDSADAEFAMQLCRPSTRASEAVMERAIALTERGIVVTFGYGDTALARDQLR